MQKLSNADFRWHGDQPDVPQMSAAEMKAFLDEPIKTLLTKINEMIGEGQSESLTMLLALIKDLQEAHNEQNNNLKKKQDRLTAGEGISIDENNVISSTVADGEINLVEGDHGVADLPYGTSYSRQGGTIYYISDVENAVEEALSLNAGCYIVKTKARLGDREDTVIYLLSPSDSEPLSVLVPVETDWGVQYTLHRGPDLSNYVQKNEFATYSKMGLVQPSSWNGIMLMNSGKDGLIGLSDVRNSNIDARVVDTEQRVPLLLRNLDYAVKSALTDCRISWTEEEKAAARTLLGIE